MLSGEAELVTVIITTYKRPVHILERAINSVLSQTHKNIELIIINDYPTDKDEDKIGTAVNKIGDSRMVYIANEKNIGAAASRNRGIDTSRGDFISFLDDDDEWLPEKTELQLSGFTNKKTGMVYSPFYNIMPDGRSVVTVRCTKSGNLFHDMLRTNCVGGASMSMIRKEVFDKCGYFDESLPAIEDYDMWLRISEKYEINYIEKPLSRRYIQEISLTSNIEANLRAYDIFMEKHASSYSADKKALNYHAMRRVNKMIEQGSFDGVFRIYFSGLKANPVSLNNIKEPAKGFIKLISGKVR